MSKQDVSGQVHHIFQDDFQFGDNPVAVVAYGSLCDTAHLSNFCHGDAVKVNCINQPRILGRQPGQCFFQIVPVHLLHKSAADIKAVLQMVQGFQIFIIQIRYRDQVPALYLRSVQNLPRIWGAPSAAVFAADG